MDEDEIAEILSTMQGIAEVLGLETAFGVMVDGAFIATHLDLEVALELATLEHKDAPDKLIGIVHHLKGMER